MIDFYFSDKPKLSPKEADYVWSFHTASMVKVRLESTDSGENSRIAKVVYDLVVSPTGPLLIEVWIEKFSGIAHSSDQPFGTPPKVCMGARSQRCPLKSYKGSYVPWYEDADFKLATASKGELGTLSKYAWSTLHCYRGLTPGINRTELTAYLESNKFCRIMNKGPWR